MVESLSLSHNCRRAVLEPLRARLLASWADADRSGGPSSSRQVRRMARGAGVGPTSVRLGQA
jgi:hypothetical protein